MAPWKAGAALTDGGLCSVVALKRVAISQGVTHWTSALGGTEHATTKLGARFHLRKLFLRQLDFSFDELDFIVTYLANETTLAEQPWWRALSPVERLETASRMKLQHLNHDEEQVLWLTSMETQRAYILLYGNAQAKPFDSTAAPVLSFAEGSVVGNLGLSSRVSTQDDAFSDSTDVLASTAAAAVASDVRSGDGVTDTMWRRVKRENSLRNAIHLYNKVVVYGPADYLVLTSNDLRETSSKSSDCLERNNWAKLFGLERFAGYFRQAVFEPGAVIAREGQQLGTLYLIIQGECRASVARDDGASSDTKAGSGDASSRKKKPPATTAELVLRHTHKFRWADDSQLAVASLGPKSATGDISLALGLPEPTTVQAVTTVRAISLSQEDFVRESGDRRDPAVVACVEMLQSAAYDTLRFVLERVEAEAKHEHCDLRLKIQSLRDALRRKQPVTALPARCDRSLSAAVTRSPSSSSLHADQTSTPSQSGGHGTQSPVKVVSLPSVVLKHASASTGDPEDRKRRGHHRQAESPVDVAGYSEGATRMTRQQQKAARAFASLQSPVAGRSLGDHMPLGRKAGGRIDNETDEVSTTRQASPSDPRDENLLFLFPTMTRQRQLHGKTLPLLPRYKGYENPHGD